MNRRFFLVTGLCTATILIGVANAQNASNQRVDTLVGVLRVHPKFHYRYYIDGFGDGQECALFGADERLKQLKPGSVIRIQGDLASKFFGDPKNRGALASTWIIYMDVDKAEVLRDGPLVNPPPPSPNAAKRNK
jgi:hypothetical protein